MYIPLSQIKFVAKYKIFQVTFVDVCSISSFSKLISPQEVWENMRKIEKKMVKNGKKRRRKISKKSLDPIPKLDLGFGSSIVKAGFGRTLRPDSSKSWMVARKLYHQTR